MGLNRLKSWQTFCISFVLPIILAIIGIAGVYFQNEKANKAEDESKLNGNIEDPSITNNSSDKPVIKNNGNFGILNNNVEVLLNIANDKVIILNTNAKATSLGDFRSVISVLIYVNNKECGSDQSYVPNNWKIAHFVNASCIEHVSKGDLRIKFVATGAGTSPISSHGSYTLVDR